jgi:hypothetical protein
MQTDTASCKRLASENHIYICLETQPRWTTLKTCCRECVAAIFQNGGQQLLFSHIKWAVSAIMFKKLYL